MDASTSITSIRTVAFPSGETVAAVADLGPIINLQQLQGLRERIGQARKEGARQIAGGEPRGLVLPPRVFVDATNDMSIASRELFGLAELCIRRRKEQRPATLQR